MDSLENEFLLPFPDTSGKGSGDGGKNQQLGTRPQNSIPQNHTQIAHYLKRSITTNTLKDNTFA